MKKKKRENGTRKKARNFHGLNQSDMERGERGGELTCLSEPLGGPKEKGKSR